MGHYSQTKTAFCLLIVFMVTLSRLQSRLLWKIRLKTVENTRFYKILAILIMLGSVVQVHLSPPTEFSVLHNKKHLHSHRCFFVFRLAYLPNRQYRQENRPHRPSLLLAPTLSRWKADCFSVIQRSTISPLYRLRFATT